MILKDCEKKNIKKSLKNQCIQQQYSWKRGNPFAFVTELCCCVVAELQSCDGRYVTRRTDVVDWI